MSSRILLLACLMAAPALAHDLWIERAGLTHSLIYGHERSGHEGVKTLEYPPERVLEARCFDDSGRDTGATWRRSYPAQLPGDCALSWFLTSSGYWSKTPYGTKNLPKTEAAGVMDSWRSIEAVKRLDRWSQDLQRPLTPHLELVPQENPLVLKPGDKLHLMAFFQGRPTAGVTVAYFGKPRGVTDEHGAVNIRLQEPGFQLIQASLTLPLDDGRADKTIHSSSLHFEQP